MFVVLWSLVACQDDPLVAIGGMVGVDVAPPEPTLEIPTTPPMSGEPIADGGLKEPPPEAGGGTPPPPPPEFNPISVPEGPREGGVKWEGVKRRGGKPTPIPGVPGEVGDPGLGR